MKKFVNFINFFVDAGKLKGKERRGWLAHRIKNPESTASHTFRLAILSWLLAEKEKLNIERILKMALIHDLCEVFTEDETPYDPLLPKEVDSEENQRKIREILKKWPKFSLEQKREKKEKKFKREYKALLKLIRDLPSDLKEELESLWLDFSKGFSKEGRFVKQADKAENFLQGIEYWKEQGKIQKDLWMRWAKEIFDIPVIIKFVGAIEKKFLKKDLLKRIRKKEEMDSILDFLIEVGKLKRLKRKGWVLREVKNPETVASHTFRLALEAWILGRERGLNLEKLLKMALIHDLCELYAGSITPYDHFWPKDKRKQKEILKIWPRFSKKEEKKKILKKREKEYKGLLKLLSLLEPKRREEIKELWLEFDKGLNKEGRFLKQLHKIENLLQALEYWQEDKSFPIGPWWIEAKERVDDPLLLKFLNQIEKEYGRKK